MNPVLAGVPHEITVSEKVYKVRLITGRDQAEFERKLAARARNRVHQQKTTGPSTLSRKEYLEELRIIGQREDNGEFSFLQNIRTALTSAWGQRTLLGLLLVSPEGKPASDKEADEVFEQKTDEVLWLLQRLVEESMPLSVKKAKELEHKTHGNTHGNNGNTNNAEGEKSGPFGVEEAKNESASSTTSTEDNAFS